ncbi:MAG TPA: 50S ribosomal protein L29 [Kiritimatiellia bacterium]|nr:50S ribosomal protein L29 [Kiritimatiellia bacterium]
MKAKQLKELTDPELEQQLSDSRAEYFNLRVQKASGQLEKPNRLREVRRQLARVLTVKRQKEVAK